MARSLVASLLLAALTVTSLITCVACGNAGGAGLGGNGGDPGSFSLTFTTQPGSAEPGAVFGVQPIIEIRDGLGAVDTDDNTTQVTISIKSGSGAVGAVLSGTVTVTVSSGVATFTDLQIDLAASGYQLQATATDVTTATSRAFNVLAPGALITPDTQPASDVTFTIHSQQNVRAISRHIYGRSSVDFAARPANLTITRLGGNRWTAYNWETNASNAGEDWLNQNDGFISASDTTALPVLNTINQARANNAATLVTVPLIGYVAADKNGGGDVNQTANYLQNRFHQSFATKGAAFGAQPDKNDNAVYQDEFVNYLLTQYADLVSHASAPVFFSLDNEPDLWAGTHPRLRGDAVGNNGDGPTYSEMMTRTIEYANAIKGVVPGAIVFGPVNYGWNGFATLQDATDAGGRDFHTFYLQQLAAAETTFGHRVVDVLDIHWYPEAGATDASANWQRITGSSTDPAVIEARKQAPRSLWDTSYTEESWITQWATRGPIYLLSRIQAKIDAHYPGTTIGVTEYNYGGGNHISGGIAQADVLGIFGRDGVFAAMWWDLNGQNNFIFGAFEIFRDYDSSGGSFGDTSIRADNTDHDVASVYASIDAANPDRMVVVCINKANTSRTAGIQVTHSERFTTVEVWQLTAGNQSPQRVADLPITLINAFQYTMPANSVTTLVLRK